MNWTAKDVEVFLKEREYIDTAIIPLVPISFTESMRRVVEQGEFIDLLSLHLERQFKGRMLVIPPFTYMGEPDLKKVELQQWAQQAITSGFSHVFFLTSDKKWKQHEEELTGKVIYVPSIPIKDMDEHYKHSMMDKQLNNIMDDIIEGWQLSE
ncbi:YpiF family protein [Lederbergia graminis]|uniref:YpiF family protein n=1 Tax=Lederbergia graminis TaxID=735518 RepID=A0ABW0LBY0_9BACI|nr:YpiF family protein [Paenibacillus bovis]HLU22647.1 YpiF family protein [Bacillaceae bacterium]